MRYHSLIEKTHFNPNKLENKNIYINNTQINLIMISNEIKWRFSK